MCILKSDITKYVHVPLIILVWFLKPYCWWQPEIRRLHQFILLVVSPIIYQGFHPSQVAFSQHFWTINRISSVPPEETFFQFGGGCDSQSMDPCGGSPGFFGGWKKWEQMKKKKRLHPGKLTCPLKRDYFNRKYIFQPSFFRGYVSFPGGSLLVVATQIVCLIFTANLGRFPFLTIIFCKGGWNHQLGSCLGYIYRIYSTRLYWVLCHRPWNNKDPVSSNNTGWLGWIQGTIWVWWLKRRVDWDSRNLGMVWKRQKNKWRNMWNMCESSKISFCNKISTDMWYPALDVQGRFAKRWFECWKRKSLLFEPPKPWKIKRTVFCFRDKLII